MNVHVTNIYGFSPTSVVLISQHEVRNIARNLGFNEGLTSNLVTLL